jgi:hypothetical protein
VSWSRHNSDYAGWQGHHNLDAYRSRTISCAPTSTSPVRAPLLGSCNNAPAGGKGLFPDD